MISQKTATDIAVLYKDIEASEKLLDEVKKAIDRSEEVDIRDVFGRRVRTLELGVHASENSRRIFYVPHELAIPVIEATIASHRARLKALNEKAKAELLGHDGEASDA